MPHKMFAPRKFEQFPWLHIYLHIYLLTWLQGLRIPLHLPHPQSQLSQNT